MLNKDINPIEGFVIERFHKLIFTTSIINKVGVIQYLTFQTPIN